MNLNKLGAAGAILFAMSGANAEIKLPHIFSDHMVLQQNTAVPFWGWAAPGEQVKVSASWGASATTFATPSGVWHATLDSAKAGGPYTVTVEGSNKITFSDVLLGEVWVCSGQSNMEKVLGKQEGQRPIDNAAAELAASDYPNIRLFYVPEAMKDTPQDDIISEWKTCSPSTTPTFSAAAYFFGRELHKQLNVPIGLIDTSYGGTEVELWTSNEGLKKVPDFWERIEHKAEHQAAYKEQLTAWWENLANVEPAGTGWRAEAFDDSKWSVMSPPKAWSQDPQLAPFLGTALFRATFDAPASWVGKDLNLNLGAIDDQDVTYVNGVRVGSMIQWNDNRKYVVPAGVVHEGKNVVAVHMLNPYGDGGFNIGAGAIPKPEDIHIALGDEKIGLKEWRYVKGIPAEKLKAMPVNNTPRNAELFNAMINPIAPYSIQGAIWYQGEANVGRAHQYETLFPALINDWRQVWGRQDMPFYYVQIAPFNGYVPGVAAAELREAQRLSLSVPYTGMAVTTDITGDLSDIHPTNKQDVGKRLALWALAKTYGKDLEYSGPLYKGYRVEGNSIRLTFSHVGGGLVAKGSALAEFTIAGGDQKFYPAHAEIKGDEIVVRSPIVANPVAVRFAWSGAPVPNLFNKAGLPASPFRTDDWPGVTFSAK